MAISHSMTQPLVHLLLEITVWGKTLYGLNLLHNVTRNGSTILCFLLRNVWAVEIDALFGSLVTGKEALS
jgi:hypothetical protein